MGGDIVALAAVLGSFAVAAFITYSVSRSRERRAQIQADVQSKLIERFGSATELVTFLQSPAGREFVSGVQSAPIIATRERAINNFTRALVLTGLGTAFVILWQIGDNGMGFAIPGFILLSIGLANLIAAIVSMKMARSMEGGVDLNSAAPRDNF
jgi:hypothetical protein